MLLRSDFAGTLAVESAQSLGTESLLRKSRGPNYVTRFSKLGVSQRHRKEKKQNRRSQRNLTQGQTRQHANPNDWDKGVKPKKAFIYQSILARAQNFESYAFGGQALNL